MIEQESVSLHRGALTDTSRGNIGFVNGEEAHMGEKEAITQTLNVSEARKQWSGLLNRVARRETRVLIEKSGAPVAAVVSTDDLRRLEELDARRARELAILEEIGQSFQDVPPDELEREVTNALAEVRAQKGDDHGDQSEPVEHQ